MTTELEKKRMRSFRLETTYSGKPETLLTHMLNTLVKVVSCDSGLRFDVCGLYIISDLDKPFEILYMKPDGSQVSAILVLNKDRKLVYVSPKLSLEDALEEFQVSNDPPANPDVLGWFSVSNNEGVIAYFANEADARRFRLAEVNRKLNG